jgi:hypothetical protein
MKGNCFACGMSTDDSPQTRERRRDHQARQHCKRSGRRPRTRGGVASHGNPAQAKQIKTLKLDLAKADTAIAARGKTIAARNRTVAALRAAPKTIDVSQITNLGEAWSALVGLSPLFPVGGVPATPYCGAPVTAYAVDVWSVSSTGQWVTDASTFYDFAQTVHTDAGC